MNAEAAAAGLSFRFEVGGKTSIDISDAFLTKARALEIFARYFGHELSELIYGGDKLEVGEPDRPAAERAAGLSRRRRAAAPKHRSPAGWALSRAGPVGKAWPK
jgi:hypothetical protein